jgi:hypothetical protein
MDINSGSSNVPAIVPVEPPQTLAKTDLPFSGPQIMVLHGMGDGKNVTKAARLAGVHRTTLHVWRKENPDYEAAFQEWKRQGRENGRAGVISLVDLSLRTVKKDLLKGGVKTALKILESVGAFDPEPATAATGEEIAEDRVLDAQQSKIRRAERSEKLLDRHLKAAIARSERQRAIAEATRSRANALPAPQPNDADDADDDGDEQEETPGATTATPTAQSAKPIIPHNADDDPAEIPDTPADEQEYQPVRHRLDARSA